MHSVVPCHHEYRRGEVWTMTRFFLHHSSCSSKLWPAPPFSTRCQLLRGSLIKVVAKHLGVGFMWLLVTFTDTTCKTSLDGSGLATLSFPSPSKFVTVLFANDTEHDRCCCDLTDTFKVPSFSWTAAYHCVVWWSRAIHPQ